METKAGGSSRCACRLGCRRWRKPAGACRGFGWVSDRGPLLGRPRKREARRKHPLGALLRPQEGRLEGQAAQRDCTLDGQSRPPLCGQIGGDRRDDDGASWYEAGLQKDKTLLQVAPEALQSNENLFDNIFFVAADIPESVFEEPDGPNVERAEHALQSGVAALALMTKRMHVLHAKTDEALNKESIVVNKGHARLGEHGPWSSMLLGVGGESTKVWDKINDELEKIDGIEKDANGNVRVHDCTPWNEKASKNGHSYQFAKEAVAYYLEHMVKGM